jgi:hypothetical protein
VEEDSAEAMADANRYKETKRLFFSLRMVEISAVQWRMARTENGKEVSQEPV